MVFIDFIKSHA